MQPIIKVIAFFLLFTQSCFGDVVVLVHGYNTSPSVWYRSQIVQRLSLQGYADGGPVRLTPYGLIGPGLKPFNQAAVFAVQLPDTAPIPIQSDILSATLRELQRFTQNAPFTLVGHSAGGLTARMSVIQHPELNVHRLITIATPHAGAKMARYAAALSNSPVGSVADMLGMDEISDAADLFENLEPIGRNRFLRWMNHQPHPPAAYISIVHSGDDIVPDFSQDMRVTTPVGSAGITISTPAGHALNPQDGDILAALLSNSH